MNYKLNWKLTFVFTAPLSLFLTIALWNLCDYITSEIIHYLRKENYHIGAWILGHGIFATSFGLMSFLCFLIWTFGKHTNLLILTVYILLCWFSSILLASIVFDATVTDLGGDSVLLPEYKVVDLPFFEFWNSALPSVSILIPIVLLGVNIVSRSQINSKFANRGIIDREISFEYNTKQLHNEYNSRNSFDPI